MPTPSPGLNFVPRWRTMISPPVTFSPANTFTPRRLAFESRPLREEPSPFLCAMFHLRDLDPGQVLAVAGTALVAALGLELHDPQLRAALVGDHPGRHRNAGQVRVDDVGAVHEQQRLQADRFAVLN